MEQGETGSEPAERTDETNDACTVHAELPGGGRLALSITDTEGAASVAERALAAALREIRSFRQRKDPPASLHPTIIGQSPPMLALFKMLERIRASDATVLILGENGTGKELVARSVHQQSKRVNKPFVAANCSAFNDNLLESELFGHRRGAFTGAVSDKVGLFEAADGGTFFMDEVGDMTPALQVKLLRVLQEGTFMPVGGTETRKVDVRVVAATNRDLAAMVKQGTFREDLYYRLHVVVLRVPALRERGGDVSILANYFLDKLGKREKKQKTLTERAMARLNGHEWRGNVRELENEIERMWVLAGSDDILDEDLLNPSILRAAAKKVEPMPEALEGIEKDMISRELKKTGGNKTKAAEALGISRRNLIRKVQAYGIDEKSRGRGE